MLVHQDIGEVCLYGDCVQTLQATVLPEHLFQDFFMPVLVNNL